VTYDFSFNVAHDYSGALAIRVPVTLRSGRDETTFNAYVDTGSSLCVWRLRKISAGNATAPPVFSPSP
jgi:hypothetical protein